MRRDLYSTTNNTALLHLPTLARQLFPCGHKEGQGWVVGSLRGEPGHSLRIVLTGLKAGIWRDFATGEGGRDPISLVAAMEGISQAEAARRLAKMLGVFHE